MWVRGYRSDAHRTVGLVAVELDEALAIVRGFLDPLLAAVEAGSGTPSLSGGSRGEHGGRLG